jgi:soluble lytic murein transglycosylase
VGNATLRRRSTATIWAVLVTVCTTAAPARAAPDQAARGAARRLGEAFRSLLQGEYDAALALARKIERKELRRPDYATYVIGQSAALTGDHAAALQAFQLLARDGDSRFHAIAGWRAADCHWHLGNLEAARLAYEQLLRERSKVAEPAVAHLRIGEAHARAGRKAEAVTALRRVLLEHPSHPLATRAQQRLVELAGPAAAVLSPADRLVRAEKLADEHLEERAIAELASIGEDASADERRRRDYAIAMTLFQMRRQYRRAGDILVALYPQMGSLADKALFHGARALSRADADREAIGWYQKLVAQYPRSSWAAEAQFLSGWLEFNMGNYRAALPYLEATRKRFASSRFATQATWYLGFSHFLLREYEAALPYFETLRGAGDHLVDGQGRYWRARSLQELGRSGEAVSEYRALVGRHPFSWYALLARARLSALGQSIDPFGDSPRSPDEAIAVASQPSTRLARSELIRAVDELLAADLPQAAAFELRRGERSFIRKSDRAEALATVVERYHRAGDYNRPWMLALVWGGDRALDAPPRGRARFYWLHGYPLAYRRWVDKYRGLGSNPPYYLYAIMHKESGFDRHTHSYADARGLLQMIPATTRRVAAVLGIEYTDDLLFDPERNIQTGSWYIGHLLEKFRGQIPIGAGSFNCGPRSVMRWLDQKGERPMDEFVELVPYTQTRNYMKKVTEIYARYLYLYTEKVYEQPLVLDRNYLRDELTY